MRKFLFSIIVFCLGTGISVSGTIDPKNPDSKYLEYGQKHTCVLPIECHIDIVIKQDQAEVTKSIKYTASCVAITPRWIITAAHVVKDSKKRYILHENKKIEVEMCGYHSDFDDTKFGVNDIALCYLSENLNLNFYPELYEEFDEIGKINSQAGYGATGTFLTGAIRNDGKKRAGSNIISHIEKHLLICLNTDKKTAMEFMIANGDSGGGLFIDKKLAGIHSCVFSKDGSPNSDYGDTSGHTRISIFKAWIKDTIYTIEKLYE